MIVSVTVFHFVFAFWDQFDAYDFDAEKIWEMVLCVKIKKNNFTCWTWKMWNRAVTFIWRRYLPRLGFRKLVHWIIFSWNLIVISKKNCGTFYSWAKKYRAWFFGFTNFSSIEKRQINKGGDEEQLENFAFWAHLTNYTCRTSGVCTCRSYEGVTKTFATTMS